MSLPDRAALGPASPEELLALYGRIVEELLSRGVVRSTNNPVADYSEYLVARAFNLTLVANANIGFDAIGDDDVRYQVNARRLTPRNGSRQLGFIRGLEAADDPFDVLVGILFETDFRIRRAALIPIEVVRERAARVDYVNGWRFILGDAVWSVTTVRDVTDAIRRAAGEPAVAPALVQTVVPGGAARPGDDARWSDALTRYCSSRMLSTRARNRPFEVRSGSDELVITPETGRSRRVFAPEFLRSLALIDTGSRQELLAVTFNSSYLEAIADDLRSRGSAVGRGEPAFELTTLTPTLLVKLAAWTPDTDPDLPRSGYGYRADMSNEELYDAARAWWVLDPRRAQRYSYVAAVAGGVIRGVWEINHGSWRSIDGSRFGNSSVRWAFDGRPAPADVRREFVGRSIPTQRPDGGAVFGSGSVVAYWPK